MDETSVNLWQYRRRMWMPSEQAIKVPQSKDRGSGITIIGAISNKRPDMVYLLAESTNKQATKDFFLKMNRQWAGVHEAVIVMDNHPAHHSHLVEDCLNNIEVDCLFLPPNSSPLNPIERVWGTLKHWWKTYLISNGGKTTPEQFRFKLEQVIRENVQNTAGEYWRSNLKDCSRVLSGNLV